jgi:uncharacterized protein YdiU (UPF0061 family)
MRENTPMQTLPHSDLAPTGLSWSQRFSNLGEVFTEALEPAPLPQPYWVGHSNSLADRLGLPSGWTESSELLDAFTGNHVLEGSQLRASVYSGHQFGVWAGQLGDGRACSLGELAGLEVQLKGAGPTPYSRRGDGRAVLRSSIREFLCSEAMHGLGIPTTRALCVTGSDAAVWREQKETAAVVTRVAPSFIRFGHFEHFCHTHQNTELQALADFVIEHFYPECQTSTAWDSNPYTALIAAVTERTAKMIARWQSVGFCHGVMNTDNMSILGLTLDYGPFQFLDGYDPAHICNHSDTQGRYAFHKQPSIAYWNLFCLGQALMPLVKDQDNAVAALETFKAHYEQAFAKAMANKLGFAEANENQRPVIEEALKLLAAEKVDFTIFWRRLSYWATRRDLADASVIDLFINREAATNWLASYAALLDATPDVPGAALMLQTNPKYILRNHLGELAIQAAKRKDFSVLKALQTVLETPYEEHTEHDAFAQFAPDWAANIEISCSS